MYKNARTICKLEFYTLYQSKPDEILSVKRTELNEIARSTLT